MIACTIGWAASSEWIALESAYASTQNAAEPTTAVSATPGIVRVGRWTPYANLPTRTSTVIDTSETPTAVRVRPAISTHAGTGVERRRLSTPDSRRAVIEMTRLTYEAAMIASAERPGT